MRIFIMFLCIWSSVFADNSFISLKGHLSKEALVSPTAQIASIKEPLLVIEISSTSGDLNAVLDFARALYELRQSSQLKVLVYINENALGPSAIIPFLADQIDTSLFISWGDIPLGAEQVLPTNILRNRVISLITQSHANASLLRLMAEAMTDSAVQIIDDNGWKIRQGTLPTNAQLVSTESAPLVVNQLQLKQLGLVQGIIKPAEFLEKYAPKQPTPLPEQPPAPTPNSLETRLAKHILFNPSGINKIGLITIDDRTNGINQSTWVYVRNALEYYKKSHPSLVILKLNTPGGEVFAAQKISDALKELDTQYDIPVVALIDNWAISAGAMLAYSTRFITVVKDGSMGAAEPVIADTSGEMKEASEKVNSALRTDFNNRANFFGRNPYIAEGMVDKDIILVQRFGKVIKLDNENQIRVVGPDADVIVKAKGKLLTLNAEDLIKYGVADILIPPTQLPPVSAEELSLGQWPASKMALFHQPFFDKIVGATIDEYKMDWKTRFFVLLAHPIVSSILFLGLMIGLYGEFNAPGTAFPATVAFTCLFLIILSSFSQEIASWLEIILLLTGLAIILIELFVLPTFGLLGIIGVIFFIMGLFGLMLPGTGEVKYEFDTKTFNAAGEVFLNRLVWLCSTLIIAVGLMAVISRFLKPSGGAFKRFVLAGHEQEGYIAGELPSQLPTVGLKGEAATTLRPSGKVMINDTLYDAITAGGFIEQGEKIIVVRLEGSVIVVNTIPKDETVK